MIQLWLIQPSNLNYNYNLGFTLDDTCFQIVSGIFLVMSYCSNASLAFLSVEHIMRDVLMVGLFDISYKWCIFLFYRCLFAYVSRFNIWFLFLSVGCFGVRCYNFIPNDFNIFLGYVLLGVKCLLGCHVITNLALQYLF